MHDLERTISLAIVVPQPNVDEVVDALNEALNALAREDVINDDTDDAWRWTL